METRPLTRRASAAVGKIAAVPAFPGTPNIAFLAGTLEGRTDTDKWGAARVEIGAFRAYFGDTGVMEVLLKADTNAVLVHGIGGRKSGGECQSGKNGELHIGFERSKS